MFAIAASVVVLSHISTTPAWCGVAESQLPLPMTRVRSFLADLRSRDPVERQCARANLDRLIHQLRSGAAPGLIEGDVEQARAELRLGLVRAYLDGALRQDVTQFFSDFSSVLECTSTSAGLGPLVAELRRAFKRGGPGRELAIVLVVRLPEPARAELAADVKAQVVSAPLDGQGLGLLVELEPNGAETIAAVGLAAASDDPSMLRVALSSLARVGLDQPTRVGLVHRALVRSCDRSAVTAAETAGRGDPRIMAALIDLVRGKRCETGVREQALATAFRLYRTALPCQHLMSELVSDSSFPAELKHLALTLLASAPWDDSLGFRAVLSAPSLTSVDAMLFADRHSREFALRSLAFPPLPPRPEPAPHDRERTKRIRELEAALEADRRELKAIPVRASRHDEVLGVPGLVGCAGLVALQLELDVSRHGRVTRVAVSPPTHRGAGCVRRALTQARFAPASIDVRVAIPWVVTPLAPEATPAEVDARFAQFRDALKRLPRPYMSDVWRLAAELRLAGFLGSHR